MYILNDEVLKEDIMDTLVEHYEYSKEEATKFIYEHIDEMIECMFEAQESYIEHYAEYKGV